MTDETFEDLLARVIELQERGAAAEVDALLAADPATAVRIRSALRAIAGEAWRAPEAGSGGVQFGDFRLLQRLGSGGMGIVWLAEQSSLRRKVAVKIVRPELLASPIVRERFRRETETVARLQHPGIVQVLAVGDEGGARWLAMEYLPGCSLADVLHGLHGRAPRSLRRSDFVRAGGLEPAGVGGEADESWWQVVVAAIAEVADTVAFVHAHGLVHRDLKPSNVMVTPQGRTKLLDFGLVHVAADATLTRSGAELGSPAYMSPEQVLGRAIDERTDVYSLAVTLRHLLTLRLPFATTGEHALRQAIVHGDTPRGWWREAGCPRDLGVVVDQAMDVDRERRHATMAAFAADLRAVLAARPIAARGPSVAARFERWRRRRPFAAGGLAVVAALVLLVPLPLWWWQRDQARSLDSALTLAEGDLGEAEAALQRMLTHAAALDLAVTPEAAPIRLQLMEDAIGFYDRMIARHPGESRLRAANAECCWRYGMELRVVGRREEARHWFQRAAALYTTLPEPVPESILVLRLLGQKAHAILLREVGDLEGSERTLDEMATIVAPLLARGTAGLDVRMQAAEIDNERAMLRLAMQRPAEAVALLRGALQQKRAIAADAPELSLAKMSLAMQCGNLADALGTTAADRNERERLCREAEALVTASRPEQYTYFWESVRGDVACSLGRALRERGALDEAERQLAVAAATAAAQLRLAPKDSKRLRTLAAAGLERARIALAAGDVAAATTRLAEGRAAVAILREQVASDGFTRAVVALCDTVAAEVAAAANR